MKCLGILTLILACGTCFGMSFPDKHNLPHVEKRTEISGFDLFRSPIQPGGTWGLTVNAQNVLKMFQSKAKKAQDQLKLLDKYVAVLVDSDDAVIALRNDPAPDANWKTKLKELKKQRTAEIKAELLQRYAAG